MSPFFALGSAPHRASFAERMLPRIDGPILDAFNRPEALKTAGPLFSSLWIAGSGANVEQQQDYFPYDIPQIRRYQNSHKAPVRFYTGGGAVTLGGVMLIAGYRQDTKYPWSGPYMSLSPLNVFGVLIAVVGLGLLASGLIYYSKYKKHVIAPYHKPY